MTDPMPADLLGLTDTASVTPLVTVNGLTMPVALYGRVMAALRGLFPNLANLSDPAVVQAVMREYIVQWLSTWESRQAAPDPSVAAAQAQQQAQHSRDAAASQAVTDCQAITPTVTS